MMPFFLTSRGIGMTASLLFVAVAAGVDPLATQRVTFNRAAPCVRLLNASGPIGCATTSRGILATLHVLRDAHALAVLLAAAPEQRVAVALAAPLFEQATLSALTRVFGANLNGVLVLHASTLPPDASSPAPAVPLGSIGGSSHEWNGAGNGLSLGRFPFGIVLLDQSESSMLLEQGRLNSSLSHGPPLVDMRYPMSARGNAATCLAAGECLPLGGQSIWGSLRPRTAAPPPPPSQWQLPNQDFAGMVVPSGKPVVALTAQLDATSFFHDHAPGANAAVSSVVALLAAVDAIASSTSLAAQLPSLSTTPLFFLFTGEAWGELGSRRLLTDVGNFTCETPSPPPPPPPALPRTAGQRDPLPPPPACTAPYKRDRTFEELRRAPLRSLIQIGPVGAREASRRLFVHRPTGGSVNVSNAAVDALHAAASAVGTPSIVLTDASSALGLPPGPARSFTDPKLAYASGISSPAAAIATLTDFDTEYRGGGRHGSRFDSLDALDAAAVCDASSVAVRAWWSLAGGSGKPAVNCSLVEELLECLLPALPATSAASPPSPAPDGIPSSPPPPPPCALARSLGVRGELTSHYTGVFISSPSRVSASPTTRFAAAFLERTLAPVCDTAVPSASAPCEAAVLFHDAYPAGIAFEPDKGSWRVTDPSEPLWAESNWPAEMYTVLYPHGVPSTTESVSLVAFGLASALLTLAIVHMSHHRFKVTYKRL